MRTEQGPNTLRKALLSCLVMLVLSQTAFQQNSSTVAIPRYDDKYSKLVRQLEGGETNINYREFRDSFLDSEQLKVAGNQKPDLDTLRKTMHQLMQKSKYPQIIDVAKKMLSIDYTDMEAHKILQQTYKILGDASNQKKYHDIEFGLLNSIVKNGDGKTCQTAWPVIQVQKSISFWTCLARKFSSKASIQPAGSATEWKFKLMKERRSTTSK